MHFRRAWPLALVVCSFFVPSRADAVAPRELTVHLAQANNDSPYAFVRAKFEPGELIDPWAVRFLDGQQVEIPFFVWDFVTWDVARDGRRDWGNRYALLNHAPGNSPEALTARGEKLAWAAKNGGEPGRRLAAQAETAAKAGESVCAVLYLLRRNVPALGKDRLTLRLDSARSVEPKRQNWKGAEVRDRVFAEQGELAFVGLPDRLLVKWKGRELFRSAGFDAGGTADSVSHADPSRPFTVETTTGIVTKLIVTGQTKWREDGAMNWQGTYWLFPEGSYVGLEGFSLSRPAQYRGGPQQLSRFVPPEGVEGFAMAHAPRWEKPWWLHQVGDRGFMATHLFHATPLTIGYGNNPFTVNAEGPDKDPRVDLDDQRLTLRWFHEVSDPAISRLMGAPLVINGRPVPTNSPPAAPRGEIKWESNVDWLYRQYVIGAGEKAETAERALRDVLGAAAGWIDRPVSEEQMATMLVGMMDDIGRSGQSAEIGLLRIIPAVLRNNAGAIQEALRDRLQDYPARTDFYIDTIRKSVADGLKPAGGSKLLPDGTRQEGWTGNPCYHACLMPCYVRVLDHFDVPYPREAYRHAILRYADFGLDLLGGDPIDFDKYRATLEGEWPSRVVPTIPLMLHAYTLQPDEKYARAARILFDDLLHLVERNPHGYFPAWTFNPQADKYDTVYNPVSYERGISAFWCDDLLPLIGRNRASQFVAAQARWFVYSGQLLDTLEIDNATAIRAVTHGGHTALRNQIGIYLYDDFDFYRGLIVDLVTWSAAGGPSPSRILSMGTAPYRRLELSNAGSSMVRWALGIRPNEKWLKTRLHPLPKQKGFRLEAWNRLPQKTPTILVSAKELGLEVKADVLEVKLQGAAFRQPAVFAVTRDARTATVKVTHAAKIRLAWRDLWPDWPPDARPELRQRSPDGPAAIVTDDVVRADGTIEWSATPGEFELEPK